MTLDKGDKGDKGETGGALQVEGLKDVETFSTHNKLDCMQKNSLVNDVKKRSIPIQENFA